MRVSSLFAHLVLTLCVFSLTLISYAQPGALGTNNIVGAGFNCTNLTDLGTFRQARLLAGTNSTGTFEFPATCSYPGDIWRPYVGGSPQSVFNAILAPNPGGNFGALYNSGNGGASGNVAAVTSGRYYTFNIRELAAPNNLHFSILETNFNPVVLSSVTSAWGNYGTRVVTVTAAAAPSSGENVYVRYTTDSYVTSTIIPVSFVGATGTATIPTLAQNASVSFYVYSSNKSVSAINTDVTNHGQFAHDLNTLNLGAGGSYAIPNNPVIVTSSGGSAAAVATGYATLTAAFTTINGAAIHLGAITIAINGNTNEGTGTAALNQVAGVTSIGIQPTGGVARTITGATTAGSPLINFTGADNVTINGLNTGGNSLTISNTTVSNSSGTATIRFGSDATSNTITNCNLQGSMTMAAGTNGGIVFFSTGTTTGNDNNIISNCNIGPAGSNLPSLGIVGNGSQTTTAIGNSGIQITNNNFIDIFNGSVSSSAIYTSAGCNTWTIDGNRIFQTASRAFTATSTYSPISILNSSATFGAQGFTISNNIIGYASATQTGTMTFTGAFASRFFGIRMNGITGGTLNTISGNTIAGISFTGSTANGTLNNSPFYAIYAENGVINITNNTIGSLSATGSIVYSFSTTTATDAHGILNYSLDVTTISNNNIGGINVTNTSTGTTIFYGIRAQTLGTFAFTCENNVIGGTVDNSIALSSSSASSRVFGITNDVSPAQINTNTVRNLTSNAPNTGTGTTAGVIGIRNVPATVITVSGNTVHSLSNTTATAATSVVGISISATTGTISRNLVHSLSISSSSASSEMTGIAIQSGTNAVSNNMVRLGINAAGSSLTTGYTISGINDALGTNNYYHNSVFIGGTGVGTGVANTFAFNSTVTTNTREFLNNIFVNERSNATTGGKHYAVRVGGSGVNPGGLTSNFNLFRATGTGSFIGLFNAADRATLGDWQAATGQDQNSIVGNPQFLVPNGNAAAVDLHISTVAATPIEAAGTNVASVTVDFDNQTRSSLSPVDIGADAGNFIAADVSAPTIAYTALPTNNCGFADVALSGVTITDATGLPVSPSLGTSVDRPRIYFRKNTGSWVSAPGTLTSGTATNSVWSFTISSAAMGGLVTNDVVSYYVIAQDAASTPNVGSNPSNGLVATNVNTVTTHPTTPNSYTVREILNGIYTVGASGSYPTLTAAVNAWNTQCIGGPVVFSLTDATYSSGETFPIVINANAQATAVNNLTIKPAAGVSATITGSAATNLIRLNGANFITIDGSNTVSGTTKDLTISNTNLGGTAVTFINDASNNAIRNTILRSVNNNNNTGTILIGAHVATGNDNITIDNCDLAPGATTPWNAIWSSTGSTTVRNGNITVNNCNIFDYFSDFGTQAGINLGTGNNAWTITNNRIYQTTPRTFSITASQTSGILINDTGAGGDGFVISNNTIGFANSSGTGIWSQSSGPNRFVAIDVNTTETTPALSTMNGNVIGGISMSSTTGGTGLSSLFSGILVRTGRWDIGNTNGNIIGSINGTNPISVTSTSSTTSDVYGIYSLANLQTNISNNQIGNMSVTFNSGALAFFGIRANLVSSVTATISNNTIGSATSPNTNSSTATAARSVGIQVDAAASQITGNTISNLIGNTTNTLSSVGSTGIVGVSVGATSASSHLISQNTIFSLENANSATASSWIMGIQLSGSTSLGNLIERNSVHSFDAAQNSCQFIGIECTTGNVTVQNNMVRLGIDAGGNSITTSNPIFGIRKNGTGNQNFYFNSVFIGGTGVGTIANNSAAFRRNNTGTDIIRNNIFVNNRSNATTGGVHYAVSLNGVSTLTLNNNVYQYNGTGGAFALNNATAVSVYAPNWVAGDASSLVGNPNFIDPTGSASSVNLRINALGGSAAESAGVEIAGITSDIDATNARPAGGYPLGGQANGGGTAPDAGADEGDFAPGGDTTPPIITYTAVGNTCATGDRTISSVNITDVIGLPSSPSLATSTLRPRVYYRKNAGAWFSNAGTLTSGTATSSVWSFTIIAADMGGLTSSDVVQYYIIAQDDASTPNVVSNPSLGLVATDVNTVSTHPTTPNSFTITPTLNGAYNVGVGQPFTTVTAAVNAYNTSCLTGPVTFTLTDATYPSETYPITINANVDASVTNTLTIKPTQSATTFSGTSSSALIVLNGADYVIIDGSTGTIANSVCPEVYASRNLTFTNSSASTSSAVLWMQTTAANDAATNNIIRNCNVVGNSVTTTLVGIGSGSTTISTSSAGNGNNNNRIENNNISRVQIGIQSRGTSVSNKTTGTVINNNQLNGVSPNNILLAGIHVGFEDIINIERNTIANIGNPSIGTTDGFGIACGSLSISNTSFGGNEVTNANVSHNNITNIRSTASYTSVGVYIAPATNSGTNNIVNNMISNVVASGSAGDFGAGIFVGGGAGTHNIHYNSVYVNNTTVNSGSGINFGVAIGGSNPTVSLRNNSVSVTTGSQTTGAPTRAIGLAYSTYTNLSSNNNSFFASGGNTTASGLGIVGSLVNGTGTNQATLAAWQTTTSQDANSLNVQLVPVSGTDLHVIVGSNIAFDGAGAPVATTVDFDCAARNATTPDIGADEFDVPQNDAGVTAVSPSNPCAGSNTLGVTVSNFGGSPITSVDLVYSVNGGGSTTQSFSSLNIAPGSSTVLSLSGVVFTNSLSNQSITISTSNPNGVPDVINGNDTFTNNAVLIALSGTYTVGSTGNFATITSAVNRANTSGLCGPVVFSLIDAAYTAETLPITINSLSGSNTTNTLTIKPSGVTAISGTSASAIFVLNGADNIIMDGSSSTTVNSVCPLVQASRDLTITNNSTSSSSAVIWLQSLGAGSGATNNIIRNTNLVGGSSTGTLACIGQGSSTIATGSNGADNDNNRFENNSFSRAQYGVFSQGLSALNFNTGTTIELNSTLSTPSNNISRAGVYVGFEDGAIIRKNTISNISGNTTDAYGISAGLTTVSVSNPTGNQSINLLIEANTITTVRSNSSSAMGVAICTVTAAGPNRIHNNMISDVLNTAVSADYGSGILVGGGSGGSTQVYNNTVSMSGTATGTDVRNYALSIQGTNPVVDVRNNIFVNTVVSNATLSPGVPNGTSCIGLAYNSPYTNLTSNNNAFFVNAGGNIGSFGGLTNANPLASLSAWQTTIGVDGSSISGTNPVFVSATDLHLDASNTTNYVFNAIAANLASITIDIDCEARVNPYDIGADEITVPNCSAAIGGTAVATNPLICGASGSTTITASGFSPLFVGISYSWETSNDGVSGWTATGQTNPASFNTGTITATRFYRLAVTCSFGPVTNYSNVVTVTVAPVPTATASSNSPVCEGANLNLSGGSDIGVTYAWTGPNSFSSTAQNPTITGVAINAAGTYSLIATSAAGCPSVASVIEVIVNGLPPTPTISPVTATICNGGSISLSASTAGANGNVIQGSGALTTTGNTNLSTLGPNPLQNYYGGSKQQMIFTSAELSTLGFVAGTQINSIGVHMNSANTTYALQNLVVKVGHTSASDLSVSWIGGLTTVRPAASYTLNTGVNTLTFSTPFTWNGSSNLVIEINYSNNNTGTTTTFNTATFDNTGTTVTTRFYRVDSQTAATVDAFVGAPTFTYTSRNRITFNTTTAYTYAWTPTTGLTPVSGIGATVTAAPTSTTVYSVTATNSVGCNNTSSRTVTVNQRPTASIAGTTTICAGATATLTLTVTGTGTVTGQLSDGTTFSGTAPSISVNVTPSSTTTYTITSLSDANCSSNAGDLSGSATVTVNPLVTPSVTIAEAPSNSICAGDNVTFTATPTNGGTSPSYAWTVNGVSAGTNSATFSSTTLTNGAVVQVTMTSDAVCPSPTSIGSNTITMVVQTPVTYYQDADGDGFGNQSVSLSACAQPVGYIEAPVGDLNGDGLPDWDCADNNDDVNPSVEEYCSGIDDDCDGAIDEFLPVLTYWQDLDNDGFGNSAVFIATCEQPFGYVLGVPGQSDCNDSNASINPGVMEICLDLVDNDCDGSIDEGCVFNDQRVSAQFLPVGDRYDCQTTSGTLAGATASPQATAPVVTGEDVWYYFTATSEGVSIRCITTSANVTLELQSDGGTPLSIENVNTGTSQINAIGNEILNYVGLTLGQTYFLCVRNVNSAQGSGSFQLCSEKLSASECDVLTSVSSPLDLCDNFKAKFTGANQYIYTFNGTAVVNGPTNGSTILPAANIPGVLPGQTYTVSISARYDLTNGLGQAEVFTVGPLSTCNLHTGQALMTLRNDFACPNNVTSTQWVRAVPTACGPVIGYQWEFTRTLPSPAAAITVNRMVNSPLFPISTIPGVQPGFAYTVRIRPIYTGNVFGTFGASTCMQLQGAAATNNERTAAAILPVGLRNACTLVSGTLTGATNSPEANSTTITGEDVWYSFVAPAEGVSIRCITVTSNIVLELQTAAGSTINTENLNTGVTMINPLGNEVLNYVGLTIGQTYFLAVRNFNSGQGTGVFQLCAERLAASQCDIFTTPTNRLGLCGNFKARFTGANQYIYTFDGTNVVNGPTTGSTFLPLAGSGLMPNSQYTVSIDAIYNIQNGLGVTEVFTVPGVTGCILYTAQHEAMALRLQDACPNARNLSTWVRAMPTACGPVIGYDWEFTRTLPTASAPIAVQRMVNSPFFRVGDIPGVQLGATYNVRMRPIYTGNVYGVYGGVSCLVVSSTGMGLASEEINPESLLRIETEEVLETGTLINVFPNPSNGNYVQVALTGMPEGDLTLRILDEIGREVYINRYVIESGQLYAFIEMTSRLSAGVYMIEFRASDGSTQTRRLAIQN